MTDLGGLIPLFKCEQGVRMGCQLFGERRPCEDGLSGSSSASDVKVLRQGWGYWRDRVSRGPPGSQS